MKIFARLSQSICFHYGKILLVALAMLLISGFFAGRLEMQLHFSDLLPVMS